MRNKISIVIIIVLAALVAWLLLNRGGSEFNYAWINSAKLYNEFKLKKQLEGKFNAVQLSQKSFLDSLELELKLMYQNPTIAENKMQSNAFYVKRDFYLEKKQELEAKEEELEQQFNEQILKQLNQYLEEYAKTKRLELLFGADGKGTIIYATNSTDVTDEAIIFCNTKFDGK